MTATASISQLLLGRDADRIALAAPERAPLTYARLGQLLKDTRLRLSAHGVGPGDKVAIVLPNGPAMAAVFLSVAACAATAPLNPAYREDEFEFYLSDLEAKALIVETGLDSPARAVAHQRGIPVIELRPDTHGPAGAFELGPPSDTAAAVVHGGWSAGYDVALLLHTSGTTSRPKLVPLTHANIIASARNIGRTLALAPTDRCLNIMPLFHIHGLIGAVLSSLAAGGSVYCTPGFNALKFFSWLDDSEASWYSAVPTMHQAILARADRNRDVIARRRLRFIRSSSASLPPPVMAELEAVFGCPVIESYGMTEASHQMTSNLLPPDSRKPGSVGVPAGPEVVVIDETGRPLPPETPGEVVIRGPNVTAGYVANPAANAGAYINGWFRTGDQGVFDRDGFLTITGRLKELINRGGEKVSPREVDDILMSHPAVGQAVTFALPHAKLGEEVAAAIVLREGKTVSEQALKDFAATRLADFKVPRRILFLDEIPKGPTGKLQRIGLAAKLGLGP
jgi:acyl-CoA synthetase (AMP-forming)/AMP-acid ligase II